MRNKYTNFIGIKSLVFQVRLMKVVWFINGTRITKKNCNHHLDNCKKNVIQRYCKAHANRILQAGSTGWRVGVNAIEDKQATRYVMPARGRIFSMDLSLH